LGTYARGSACGFGLATFTTSTLNFAGVNQDQVNTTRDGMITNNVGRITTAAGSRLITLYARFDF
jgi:hypothetical protein